MSDHKSVVTGDDIRRAIAAQAEKEKAAEAAPKPSKSEEKKG